MAQPISTSSEAVCEGQAKIREDSLQASSVVPELSPVARATGCGIADVVSIASGVGGFDIDPAARRLSFVSDDVAIEEEAYDVTNPA